MAYADKFLQTHHVVQALCVDESDVARTGDIISLKNYDHVAVLFTIGAIAAGADIDLKFYACSDVAGSNNVQITPISYRKMLTTTDTWTLASELTNGIIDIVSNGHVDIDETCATLVVEFDAADIYNAASTAGIDLNCFYCTVTASAADSSVNLGAYYMLYPGARYASRQMPTAITD